MTTRSQRPNSPQGNPEALMQQAVQDFQAGDAKKALAKCKKLIKAHPGAPQPHNLGGVAAFQCGDLALAKRYLTTACQIAPTWADAWSNLGIILKAQGNLPDAAEALTKALTLEPQNSGAMNNMAGVKEALGELSEAEKLARDANAILPKNPDYMNTLAQILAARSKLDEAEALYWQIIDLHPHFNAALFNLANFLETNNRLDRMPRLIKAAETVGINDVNLAIPYAKYLRREKHLDQALAILDKHRKSKMPPRLAKLYYGELGTCLDKAGRYPEAFENFIQSNKMAKTAAGSSVNKTIAINRITAMEQLVGDQTFLKQSPNDLRSSPTPAFLVGFPRSGTTLLEQVLDSHPDIQAIPEQNMVVNVIDGIGQLPGGYPSALTSLTDEQQVELTSDYWQEANRHIDPTQPGLVVDKMPLNMGYVPMLWRLFPSAKFIFVLRHPIDVCLSCFIQTFADNHAMANFYRFSDTVKFYDVAATAWRDAVDRVPFDHLTIRYEDVVEDLSTQARRMIDFLGLEWRDEVLDYRDRVVAKKTVTTPSYSQVSEAIYSASKGRWQNYRDLLDPKDLQVLAPHLAAFGYPPVDAD